MTKSNSVDNLQKSQSKESCDKNENADGDKAKNISRSSILPWKGYYRYDDIIGYLKKLERLYEKHMKIISFGRTHENRTIYLVKITNGIPGNHAVWVEGGIHAREWISPASCLYIIYHIVTNYEYIRENIRNVDWYIVPVLNPDGYEYSHTNFRMYRKNRLITGETLSNKEGVDLNRNFGFQWGSIGSSRDVSKNSYRGPKPFSEPETKAVRDFIENHARDARWTGYITFHSHAKRVTYPWAYTSDLPKDWKKLDKIAKRMSKEMQRINDQMYAVGPVNKFCRASGSSDDWAKGSGHFKYAFTVELRSIAPYGFRMPPEYILPIAKEALCAVGVLADAIKAGKLVKKW